MMGLQRRRLSMGHSKSSARQRDMHDVANQKVPRLTSCTCCWDDRPKHRESPPIPQTSHGTDLVDYLLALPRVLVLVLLAPMLGQLYAHPFAGLDRYPAPGCEHSDGQKGE